MCFFIPKTLVNSYDTQQKNLQKAVVVSIVINILAMDTHIALTTSEKRRRFADKILPIGTKRRALVKKVLFALKIIKNS